MRYITCLDIHTHSAKIPRGEIRAFGIGYLAMTRIKKLLAVVDYVLHRTRISDDWTVQYFKVYASLQCLERRKIYVTDKPLLSKYI